LESCNGALLLDVRSPAEYNHAHIPGAISFPLFTDEERKVVGTTYKQVSRQAAIKIGLDYFGPKMRPMVEEVEALLSKGQQEKSNGSNCIFLYCWRGGMRSGAVAWLLNLYGFNVTVLNGGYKAFRNHVLKTFEQPYDFKILGGYTGSGKTEVLQELKVMGEKVICLESVASHKGSAFGNINMPPQPTQEMFENLLSYELRAVSCEQEERNLQPRTSNLEQPNPFIWLEDESQRIGTVNLPNALWQAMRTSPLYFLEIPFEERLKHITE
jgi:tRNA 2-selenouridine synthase